MNTRISTYETAKQWEYENGFYLTSHVTRLPKMLAHYELYKSICHLPGAIVECGVFKGASFVRFCTFREVLESPYSRKIIGFDAFGKFPKGDNEEDDQFISKFENEAGDGLSLEDMHNVLGHKNFTNTDLVKGDVCETIEDYLTKHPELKIALLHIDVDVYEPTKVILNHLYERVVDGGLVVLDDYGTVEGETRAVDEFFAGMNMTIEKLPISHIPSFIRK